MNNKIKEREIIETKTTLETYKTFFAQTYLKILKTSRYQDLNYDDVLHRMRLRQNGLCQLCDSNNIETINHVMLECPAFENLRIDFFSLRSLTLYI